jgi:hypothetical protein
MVLEAVCEQDYIRKFFDTLDHGQLQQLIQRRV